MSLTINIDLSDGDLQHFVDMQEAASKAAADKSNAEIVQATMELLTKAQQSAASGTGPAGSALSTTAKASIPLLLHQDWDCAACSNVLKGWEEVFP